jgi:hypothetical protein
MKNASFYNWKIEMFHPPLLLGSPCLLFLEDFPTYPLIMASPFIRDLRVMGIKNKSFQIMDLGKGL